MKILFLPNNDYSHVNGILPFVNTLIKNNHEVHFFVGKKYNNLVSQINGLTIHYYNDEIFIKNQMLILNDYAKYNGSQYIEDISYTDLVTESVEMLEYVLKASDNYYYSIIEEVKLINPDIIVRDSCAIFGRKISNALKIKCIGYTTSAIITENELKSNLRKYIELISSHKLTKFSDNEVVQFYKEINKKYDELCKKYYIKKLPYTYLMNPDEDINFCFGVKLISEVIDSNYYYLKPNIFHKEKYFNNESSKNIVVSSGTIGCFPLNLYVNLINAYKNNKREIIISFKLYGSNYVEINNVPNNVKFYDFIDQKLELKNASLFVSHGGYNSLIESIYYEVPLIIVPIQNDEFLNANFVEEKGIGNALIKTRLPEAAQLKITCEKLINNIEIKKNLRKLKKEFINLIEIEDFVNSIEILKE